MTFIKKECTSKQYEIKIDDLIKITDTDFDHGNNDDWNEVLSTKLDMVSGVTDTDYNGHFGHYIFLRIDSEFDNDVVWNEIEKIINDHVKK